VLRNINQKLHVLQSLLSKNLQKRMRLQMFFRIYGIGEFFIEFSALKKNRPFLSVLKSLRKVDLWAGPLHLLGDWTDLTYKAVIIYLVAIIAIMLIM